MNRHPLHIIGELINHSYGRARKAWQARDIAGYQELAKLQSALGVSYLTLNIDGTRLLPVTMQEMLDFCGEHSIVSDVEIISADYVDTAYKRTVESDVQYRFVIDTSTI